MINDLDLPIEAIEAIATSGDNGLAVTEWCEELRLYDSIKRKYAIAFVKELGLYTEKQLTEMPFRALIELAIWALAWNRFEENAEVTQ